jgi:2-(1,2-epoxy-1,2-dihydrophenyl)acetyl-CoA isomerase
VEAGVARLTLNRPDKLNSFTGEMHAELRDALDAVQADKAVRVLVLTGAGRAFCAGQDLADPDMARTPSRRHARHRQRGREELQAPGAAPAEPARAHHRRRQRHRRRRRRQRGAGLRSGGGSKSASFLQAFSKIGLVPDTGGTWFLPQRVGMARAMGLALLADKLPAEKAADWGLIWAAYDDAEFAAKVDAWPPSWP